MASSVSAELVSESGDTVTSQFIFYEGATHPVTPPPEKSIYGNDRHNISYIPSSKGNYEVVPDVEYNYFLMVLSKEYYFILRSSCFDPFCIRISYPRG